LNLSQLQQKPLGANQLKNKLIAILAIAILMSVALGCAALREVNKAAKQSNEPKIVTSTDGKVQLTVPPGWKTQNLNDQAIIQVAKAREELYTIVIASNKVDFDDNVGVDDVVSLVQRDMKSTVENAEISDSSPIEINGLSGKQFEVKGSVDMLKVTYIYYVIDTKETFYQVMSWTLTSRFQKNAPILREVMSSLKLTKATDRISAPPPPKRLKRKSSEH